jgi:hypothetical protein
MRLDFDASTPRHVQLLRLSGSKQPARRPAKTQSKAKALAQRGRFDALVSAYWRGEFDAYRAQA